MLMMASLSGVPFGGVGILRMVSRSPSAAASLVGSMSRWILRIASNPLLFDATASSRIKARSLPLAVPAKKLNSWRLRPFSASLSWSMRTWFSDLMWRSISSWYATSLVMRYILDCSEFPIAPQSSVFLRTARKLQFLGLGCQSRCLRPFDLGQCSCCCLGCCGGCLKGYTEGLFSSTSHGEVLRPSPFGDDQWSITGSDTVGQALAQEPLTRRAPLPCNEVQAARAAYGLLVFL